MEIEKDGYVASVIYRGNQNISIRLENTFKVGDSVFYNCLNPATGFVKRVAKNGEWADVEWNVGLSQTYVSRTLTKNLIFLNEVLNKALPKEKT